MIEVTASGSVPVPPERVWELTSDTTRYAEWVVGTDEVTRTDGPAREGSTYDERNTILGPWKARSHWRVNGPLGGLFARAMRPRVRRDNRRTVEQFAELAGRELAARAPA